MTEEDYLKATNRVKISAALVIVRDVLPGEDYGISNDAHKEIMSLLAKAEENLFLSFKLEEQNDPA